MGSDPNIDRLEQIYAEWARGDFTRNDLFATDVEFVTDFPERVTYHGHDGLRRGWFDFLSAWNDFTVDLERIIPAGDDRYVALVGLSGRGKESGVPIEGNGANLIRFRDGKIVYFAVIWDREQALAWGGLNEDA
jgi:ketosteroid isomerase-like protein